MHMVETCRAVGAGARLDRQWYKQANSFGPLWMKYCFHHVFLLEYLVFVVSALPPAECSTTQPARPNKLLSGVCNFLKS